MASVWHLTRMCPCLTSQTCHLWSDSSSKERWQPVTWLSDRHWTGKAKHSLLFLWHTLSILIQTLKHRVWVIWVRSSAHVVRIGDDYRDPSCWASVTQQLSKKQFFPNAFLNFPFVFSNYWNLLLHWHHWLIELLWIIISFFFFF